MSVFFTLSGYLITSLSLAEHERTGRLDVGAFYGRRLRRLLPASLACLAGIVVLAAVGLFDGVTDLRRDIWGSLAQVYNWVALSGGQSYADLVDTGAGALSPVEHYWSLAIEEQFYWVWPLVLVAVLRAGRRGRLLAVSALAAATAVAAPLIAAVWGPDAAYWATPARLGEILGGALVAVVLHGRRRDVALPAPVCVAGRGRLGRGRVGGRDVAQRLRPGLRGLAARVRPGIGGADRRAAGAVAAAAGPRHGAARRSRERSATASTCTTGRSTSCSTRHGPARGGAAVRPADRRDARPRHHLVPGAGASDPDRPAALAAAAAGRGGGLRRRRCRCRRRRRAGRLDPVLDAS